MSACKKKDQLIDIQIKINNLHADMARKYTFKQGTSLESYGKKLTLQL